MIGVDIGTQGSKGALIAETGQIVATYSVEQDVSSPHPGWSEHDADHAWWGGFVEVVRRLLLQSQVDPHYIAGVGVRGLMPVMLPVDGDCRPLRPAILYADIRARAEMVLLNEQLAGWEPVTSSLMMCAPRSSGSVTTSRRAGDAPAPSWRTQGYVIAKLTGRHVIDSFTAIGMRPFINETRDGWRPGHLRAFRRPDRALARRRRVD